MLDVEDKIQSKAEKVALGYAKEAAILELEDLVGQYAQSGIDAGSIITDSMLGELRKEHSDAVLLGVNM